MALVNIYLGGKLGANFGKKWRLDVSSPAEAIRAIDVNLNGKLRAYLTGNGSKRYYKIGIGRKDNLLEKQELNNPSGSNDIYILPTVKGRGSAIGKIIAGVIIVLVTYFTYGTATSSVAAALYGVGASLIVGGVVQLLTPIPNFNQNSQGDSRGSNIFQGNAVAASQGGAVGLIYGRALVTPMPISISYTNVDADVSNATFITNYTPGIGGGGIVNNGIGSTLPNGSVYAPINPVSDVTIG